MRSYSVRRNKNGFLLSTNCTDCFYAFLVIGSPHVMTCAFTPLKGLPEEVVNLTKHSLRSVFITRLQSNLGGV